MQLRSNTYQALSEKELEEKEKRQKVDKVV